MRLRTKSVVVSVSRIVRNVNDDAAQSVTARVTPGLPLAPGTVDITYSFIGTGDAEGISFTDTFRITIYEIDFRPIMTEMRYANMWESLLNPSGFEVGSFGGYTIKVEPAHLFPDSEIKWKITEGADKVSFMDGDTGRLIAVEGNAVGDFELAIDIGGEGGPIQPTPYICGKVQTLQPVPLTVWIVTNETTNVAKEVARVNTLIADANKVFKQTAMELFIPGTINFTNNPSWYTLDRANWPSVKELTGLSINTPTLELYFVNAIENGPPAFHIEDGIVISSHSSIDSRAFVHEIGHACGLNDIYPVQINDNGTIGEHSVAGQEIISEDLSLDWGGGYYPADMTLGKLIAENLLMFGYIVPKDTEDTTMPIDIPSGSIFGVGCTRTVNPNGSITAEWFYGHIAVGLGNMTTRKPESL